MKILVFTGAGASAQFGLPTTKQFRKLFWESRRQRDDFQTALFNYENYPDIEYILQCVYDVKRLKNSLAGSFVSDLQQKREKDLYYPWRSFLNSIGMYDEKILHELFERYTIKKDQEDNLKKFYGDFFGLIKSYNDNKIQIATTNYDTTVEDFCAYLPSEYTCIDGFEKKGEYNIWAPNTLNLENYHGNETPIALMKIHGSLNWQKYGTGQFIKTEKREYQRETDSRGSVIIAPTLNPKETEIKEPFKTLLELYIKKVNDADVCIVIGSSFRDEVINRPIIEFLNNKKSLIIISPSAYQNYAIGLFNHAEIKDNTAMVEWSKGDLEENKREVKFIPFPANKENNAKILGEIKSELEKKKD